MGSQVLVGMYPDHSSAPDSPDVETRQPPLGILHLLVWTLGSALMFSLLRLADSTEGRPVSGGRSLVYLFYGLVYGAALGSLLLPAVRWWRGGAPFPRQPGHWLLLTNGLIASLLGISLLILSRPAIPRLELALHATTTALPAALYLWGALAPHGGRLWALVLALLGTMHLLQAACLGLLAALVEGRPSGMELLLYDLFRIMQSYGTLAAGLLVILATLADIYGRVPRDWLHWAGAFVELATIVWIMFGVFGRLPVFL